MACLCVCVCMLVLGDVSGGHQGVTSVYGTSQAIVRTLKARAHGPVWTDLGVVKFGRLIQDGGGVGVRGS